MKSRLGSLAPVRSILEGGFVCKATGWLVFPEAPLCLSWTRLGLAELFDVGGDHLGQGFKEQELQFLEPRDRAVVLVLLIRKEPSPWVVSAGRRHLPGFASPEVRAKHSGGAVLCSAGRQV